MKIKNLILKSMLVAFVAIVTFSCTSTDDNKEVIVPKKSILDITKADPNFSILVAALKKTGLEAPGSSPLGSAGYFTVLAPTNAAFAATPATASYTEASITALDAAVPAQKATIDLLKLILQYHILGTGARADDLLTNGYSKTFALYNATAGANLSMFVNKEATGNVLINGGAANGGATVVAADMLASNGVIHVLDRVLLLPTVVSNVIANPNLSVLKSVVTSVAGGTYGDQSAVLTALSNAKPGATALTVFAPLNDAFTAATKAGGFLTGASFSSPTTPAIIGTNFTKVLQYHVIVGNTPAASATAVATTDITATTLLTQKFFIAKNTLKITELPAVTTLPASNIKLVNIQASNGVIHAIDRVLQPAGL
jgi:uncharacterized surface protein with fasciclin (FAS1) repeats